MPEEKNSYFGIIIQEDFPIRVRNKGIDNEKVVLALQTYLDILTDKTKSNINANMLILD